MFEEGQIIYFTPFYFKNGNTAKNKYFIVLKNIEEKTIIASLPTRSNKVPSFLQQSHGCINDDERCFNCYLFESGRKICDNGFCFQLHTFIYGNEVDDYEVDIFKSVYLRLGTDYEIVGKLFNGEFSALLSCLKSSTSVKRRIKKLL